MSFVKSSEVRKVSEICLHFSRSRASLSRLLWHLTIECCHYNWWLLSEELYPYTFPLNSIHIQELLTLSTKLHLSYNTMLIYTHERENRNYYHTESKQPRHIQCLCANRVKFINQNIQNRIIIGNILHASTFIQRF